MTRPRPCSAFRRRHLARISRGVSVAESSMKIVERREVGVGLREPRPVLLLQVARCGACGRRRGPRRRACAARAAPSTSRARRCPTVSPVRWEAYWAMLRQKDVLPMAGRAATMIRSPFWSPLVISSRSTKPVGRPGDQLLRLRELVDGPEALLDDLADADEALADPPLGDVEDGLLGAVEDAWPRRPRPRRPTGRCGCRRGSGSGGPTSP